MDKRNRAKEDRLMKVKDEINNRFGANTVRPASIGFGKRPWHIRQEKLLPYWSTRMSDLPVVKDWPVMDLNKIVEEEEVRYINMLPMEGIAPTVLYAV